MGRQPRIGPASFPLIIADGTIVAGSNLGP